MPGGQEWLLMPGLEPETVYQFSVLAQNKLGTGPFSEVVTVNTLGEYNHYISTGTRGSNDKMALAALQLEQLERLLEKIIISIFSPQLTVSVIFQSSILGSLNQINLFFTINPFHCIHDIFLLVLVNFLIISWSQSL